MTPEDPVVNAMLSCNSVHRDPTTKQDTLLGVFDTIRLSSYPAEFRAFAVYLNFTNLNGVYSVELAWLRGDTEEELARLSRPQVLAARDPLTRVELSLRIPPGLPLPASGRYILRLYMNRRFIQDLAIMVERIEP
jgi:hypothetical protein